MVENRYENMTKEEILKIAKEGITINNEEERKTFYNCIGLKTEEQKRHMMIRLLIVSILMFTLILAISKIFKFSDTVSLVLVILYGILVIAKFAKIKAN